MIAAVLTKKRANGIAFTASTKFSQRSSAGKNVGGYWASSASPFRAEMIIQ